MDKKNSVFTKISIYMIITIMIVLLCSIGLRIFTRMVLIEKLSMDNTFTRIVMFDNKSLSTLPNQNSQKIDWLSLYPFENKKENSVTDQEKSPISGIIETVKNLENSISVYSKDHLMFYTKFTEGAKAYNNLLKWTIEKYDEETILTYDDGHLVGTMWKADVTPYVENISNFNAFLKEIDMPFLYAALPGKISKYDKDISGVLDFSNQNFDSILNGIKNSGGEVFDLREKMAENFENHREQFFFTDHHWKPETGLWAAREIATYLNQNFAYNFDLKKFDSENFTKETYENIFLGTYGRTATLSVANPEGIDLFYPKYSVDMSIEIPARQLKDSGDFNVFYYYKMLEPGDFYNTAPYVSYIYGDDAITKLTNNDCNNDKSILVIGDSMDNVVLPFLALGVKHITAMDLRVFNGSLQTFIKQHKDEYDMVMITNSVFTITAPKLYDFS